MCAYVLWGGPEARGHSFQCVALVTLPLAFMLSSTCIYVTHMLIMMLMMILSRLVIMELRHSPRVFFSVFRIRY